MELTGVRGCVFV